MSVKSKSETEGEKRYEKVLLQMQEQLVQNEHNIDSFTLKKMLKVLDM